MLKRLFGGSNRNRSADIFYVRIYKSYAPSETDEIVEVRVNLAHDLSLDDDGGYFSRKVVVGPHTFKKAELLLYYDKGRNLRDTEVVNGELVERADYETYRASIQD